MDQETYEYLKARRNRMMKYACYTKSQRYPNICYDAYGFMKLLENIFDMDYTWKINFEAFIDRSYNDIQVIEKRKCEYILFAYAIYTYAHTHDKPLDAQEKIKQVFGETKHKNHLMAIYHALSMIELYFEDEV